MRPLPRPMIRIARAAGIRVILAAALSAAMALPACRREERPAPRSEGSPVRTVRYTVRGLIVALPTADQPGSELQVRHEAIPNFEGQDGKLGMDTMTMPFPLAANVSLEGLAVGDKVELTFEVDSDRETKSLLGYRATAIVRLPADVQLDFTPLRR